MNYWIERTPDELRQNSAPRWTVLNDQRHGNAPTFGRAQSSPRRAAHFQDGNQKTLVIKARRARRHGWFMMIGCSACRPTRSIEIHDPRAHGDIVCRRLHGLSGWAQGRNQRRYAAPAQWSRSGPCWQLRGGTEFGLGTPAEASSAARSPPVCASFHKLTTFKL